MRKPEVDAAIQRSSRSSPAAADQPKLPVADATANPAGLLDGWDRQDGYHRQLAITVSPASLSSYGGLDGSTVSFSSFILPLVRRPFAELPADNKLLVPIFAISESETLLPLTDPSSTPTSGVATRTELARHADATFESVTGKTKAEVQLPAPPQPQLHGHTTAAKQLQPAHQLLEQPDSNQRKRRRESSPAPGPPDAHGAASDGADSLVDDRRRPKQAKVETAAHMRPTALSPIDELTPRNGRHVSAAGRASKPAFSPAPVSSQPCSRSRDRSASRSRAFDREHNPLVAHLPMPEHTERAWAARRRRLQQEHIEAGHEDDEDDDTDSLEQLIYPTPFTLIRRQRKHFAARMTNEWNRTEGQPYSNGSRCTAIAFHRCLLTCPCSRMAAVLGWCCAPFSDMWSTFCYRVRLEQEARELEKIEEEVQEEATTSPTPDTTSTSATTTTTAVLPDPATLDHEHKSRRRRERSHVTLHANDWMKTDSKYVKQDIDRVRRAILEAEAAGVSLTTPPSSRSTTPATSPASSPRIVGCEGKGEKTVSAVSLADVRAELAQSNPPSPTPSLISLSPPSSRSVSPLPTLRTHSTDTSPVHEDMSPNSALTDFSALSDAHLGLAEKQALRSLTQPQSHPAGKGGCLVEAIVAHRQLRSTENGTNGGTGGMSGDRASDWLSWRDGALCEYLVQWVESEERTWERADQLQSAMVNAYWDGRGQQLWDEKDISELHRILKAHMRQPHASHAALPIE